VAPVPGRADMRVLAFDTALGACSAALFEDGVIRARRFERRARGHAEALLPMVEAVRTEAGIAYSDLDLLAVTVGPGTFAGLRIGLAAARGLALAVGLPLMGLTTLEAIAAAAGETAGADTLLAAIDARRAEIYAQAFAADLSPLAPPGVLTPAAALALLPRGRGLVVGSGARRIRDAVEGTPAGLVFRDEPAEPDAAVIASLAAERAARRGLPPAGAEPPSPLYLRPPDARLPEGARRGDP